MPEWNDVFAVSAGPDGPGMDFEERVFAKIRRKKTQRKVGMGIAACAGVVALLSVFQLFRPLPRRLPLAGAGSIKEEVPVSEELFFSASDNLTRYSLEPVSYQEKAGEQATLNQI
ncbi:MAG: hypothetical protein MUC72_04745 [Acidobacteria bacterium]|jgi:hypothetical protein|nr:hypothetical protein [Acidobacteriota bacterium]